MHIWAQIIPHFKVLVKAGQRSEGIAVRKPVHGAVILAVWACLPLCHKELWVPVGPPGGGSCRSLAMNREASDPMCNESWKGRGIARDCGGCKIEQGAPPAATERSHEGVLAPAR
jgi:hypothetical protein